MPRSNRGKKRRHRKAFMSKRQVTIKLNELVNSLGTMGQPGPLDKLLGAKLPATLAFRLSMLAEETAVPVKHYNAQRTSLLEEFGKTSDGGKTYQLEGEGREKFEAAMAALGEEPVTLNVPALTVSDLGEREILSPADFYALRWLFAAEEAEEERAASAVA